ncbi:hypothetical protein [Halomonas sp. GD1P12]|uniref:hypothetical protein n=1 Tax=Halomonas sp. GD1P12 TaxID=2982691 RepID=UPI0021E5084E|nr:hypothetical protein [Halomonas sp. GD1P12]UYF99193.1 hypothetical protein OCT39_13285 [Halomonas sp. GD1P12]
MTQYLDSMIKDCKQAKLAMPKKDILISSTEEMPAVDKGIYIISEVGGNAAETFEAFKTFKQTKTKACCKINHPSNILYVGSSDVTPSSVAPGFRV